MNADVPDTSKRMQMPFSFGRQRNTTASPHHVVRPGGTDTYILEYALDGRGFLNGGAESLPILPGELLLFRPGVPQDYGMDVKTGIWEHIWVCFHPRPDWRPILDWPDVIPGVGRLVPETEEMRERILRTFLRALSAAHGPLLRHNEFAQAALEELLLWCDTINPRSQANCLDGRIQSVLEYLCEHFRYPASIAELAKRCNLSESRFSHLFREQVGMPPIQFLEHYRIRRAREMLLMTRKPVNAVAREVGYDNPLYFSRIFRKHAGESPRALRKRAMDARG